MNHVSKGETIVHIVTWDHFTPSCNGFTDPFCHNSSIYLTPLACSTIGIGSLALYNNTPPGNFYPNTCLHTSNLETNATPGTHPTAIICPYDGSHFATCAHLFFHSPLYSSICFTAYSSTLAGANPYFNLCSASLHPVDLSSAGSSPVL